MINLHAPICSTGYGVVGTNLSYIIKDCKLFLIGKQASLLDNKYNESVVKAVNAEYNPKNPTLKVWHQYDLIMHPGVGKYLAYPFFELNKFSKEDIDGLKTPDVIIASSKWAKEVILSHNELADKEIVVAPCGVDMDLFYPNTERKEGPVKFFNAGKWEVRKGHDILAKAFAAAFSDNDDVELHMMTNNPFLSEIEDAEWKSLYRRLLKSKVFFVDHQQTHSQVANVMRQMDCGVFPSRAEGWNLELLEMMACGKPVIATDYSAHTEYCNSNNCELLYGDEMEAAFDGKFFNGTHGEWMALTDNVIEQLVVKLKLIYEQIKQGLFLNTHGIETARNLSWNRTWQIIKENL